MSEFWRQVALLTERDGRIEGRTLEAMAVTVPFGVAALFLIPVGIGPDPALLSEIGWSMAWIVVLLFGMFITFRQTSIESPAERDILTLLGVNPRARFVGRSLASAAFVVVFELVSVPVMLVLYDPPIPTAWWWLVLVAMLVATGLAMIGTLISEVTRGVRGGRSLAPLLVAPAAYPLLVAAAAVNDGLTRGSSILNPLLLLVAADLVLAVIGVITAEPLEETAR